MNLGEFTGDPGKANSYLYGLHWKNKKGYKAILGDGYFNHRFGGNDWNLPVCPNCKEHYHQIFTFDLADPHLKELNIGNASEIVLISCLNCSSSWERQLYKLDFDNKTVNLIEIVDTQCWIQEDEFKLPIPLPKHHIQLVDLELKDYPLDEDSYYDILDSIGEDYICRILGAPVFAQSPIDIECPMCKKNMQYIASIYSQPYEREKVDFEFFVGEMSLYFYFCNHCNLMKVECQGT